MSFTLTDFWNLFPLILVAAGILLTITYDLLARNSVRGVWLVTLLILAGASYYSLLTIGSVGAYQNMVAFGGITHIFYFIFTFGAAIVVLLSKDYFEKLDLPISEFYMMLLSSVLGMMMIASAKDFLMIFIGLEQMSICFYALAGFNRRRERSVESALKYFLLGSFATGFIVYGIALIYGSAQSLSLDTISINIATLVKEPFFVIGMVLFIIGFAFKIAAFPFHMWVPDVYQGAPTTVTALMSTGGKAAAFSALILVLYPVMTGNLLPQLLPVLTVLAILSMLYGSIVAISQNDIKRMLAYSSIAHAGYMLIGLASGNSDGYAGIVFYLAAYAFMNLGAFGIISIIEGKRDNHLQIPEYAGLGFSYPVLAGLLALFMFALSGIPPFAGFFGKYYVFYAALQSGNTLLAIMGVLSSVISVYFYLRIIVVMYFNKPEEAGLRVSSYSSSALLGVMISAMLVVVMGVVPGRIIDLITAFLN